MQLIHGIGRWKKLIAKNTMQIIIKEDVKYKNGDQRGIG